jgi:hypothetical protein
MLAVRHGLEDLVLDPLAVEQHALLVAAQEEVPRLHEYASRQACPQTSQ